MATLVSAVPVSHVPTPSTVAPPVPPPSPPSSSSAAVLSVGGELLSGSVSAIVSRLLISPLDVLKIRMQLCFERRPASLWRTLQSMVRQEGVLSLWKGNMAAELMVVPYGAVSFLTYSTSKRALHSLVGSTSSTSSSSSSPSSALLTPYIPLLAGSASGVCATLATYPLDLLRTRFVAQRSSGPLLYTSLRHAVADITARDGPLGLYRGLWPTLVGIVPLMALQFHTYETAKRAVSNYNSRARMQQQHSSATNSLLPPSQQSPSSSSSSASLSASQQSGCGFVAGVVSKWLTMPLDVIKKRCQVLNFIDMQQQQQQHVVNSAHSTATTTATPPTAATVCAASHSAHPRQSGCGVLRMGRAIWRAEGIAGLFKGSVASLLKAGPNAALIYLVYEQCRTLLLSRQRQQPG